MPTIANILVTTSLVALAAFAAMPARAADIDASSAVDAVTVYPDGASVTRVITLDLPAGDNTAGGEGFPADAGSVLAAGRGRGGREAHDRRHRHQAAARRAAGQSAGTRQAHRGAEGRARQSRKARSMRPPRAANSPSALRRRLRPGSARRARRVRSPSGARPLPRSPRKSPALTPRSATPNASSATSTAKSRGSNPTGRSKPPSKLEVRIDLAAAAATKATLRVTYAVRNARWAPLYDARLDTGAKDRKPALELVRRAEITQTTGEDWSNVALAVSTVRTARGGSAPDLNSLIVQYPQPPRPLAVRAPPRIACPRLRAADAGAPAASGREPRCEKAPTSSRPRPKSAASR